MYLPALSKQWLYGNSQWLCRVDERIREQLPKKRDKEGGNLIAQKVHKKTNGRWFENPTYRVLTYSPCLLQPCEFHPILVWKNVYLKCFYLSSNFNLEIVCIWIQMLTLKRREDVECTEKCETKTVMKKKSASMEK